MFQTPILFLVFNRPDTTKVVFETIRKIKPIKLFVAADGPRADRPDEETQTEEVRRIATAIDWECDLQTLFRSQNKGCGKGVSEAIDWFFQNVNQGIILEDDCLPDATFFQFCEIGLNKYKNNSNIMHISGSNLQQGIRRGNNAYYFSNIPHIWGWATWRSAWEKYDYDMAEYMAGDKDKNYDDFWETPFQMVASKLIDTWDYQWMYTVMRNNGLSLTPNWNLVQNIGINEKATHTTIVPNWYENVEHGTMRFVTHPKKIALYKEADDFLMQFYKGNLSIRNRIRLKLIKLYKNLKS